MKPAEIKALRMEFELTQKQAADVVKISQQLWCQWESGQRTPSPPCLLLLQLMKSKKLPGQ